MQKYLLKNFVLTQFIFECHSTADKLAYLLGAIDLNESHVDFVNSMTKQGICNMHKRRTMNPWLEEGRNNLK